MNSRGFTLAETLISLMITLLILSLSFPLLTFLHYQSADDELAVLQCFTFVQEELNDAEDVRVQPAFIDVKNQSGENIRLELYADSLRRRVNNKGNEFLIKNVKTVQFEKKNRLIVMTIQMKGGDQFEKELFLPPE